MAHCAGCQIINGEANAINQLSKITYSDGSTTEFTYNGATERTRIMEKDDQGATTSDRRFLWCGGARPCEERTDDSGTGNLVVKRFYGFGVEVPGAIVVDDQKLYYFKDHLGSIRELVDDDGDVRARYDYDPWGRVTKVSGDLDADFRYTGHLWHEGSHLYIAKYRAYESETGMWISRDPIGEKGGQNLYGYGNNNPILFNDPTGLTAWIFCTRCKEDPQGSYDCIMWNDQNGNTSSFSASTSENPNQQYPEYQKRNPDGKDPYGSYGPIPPGTYPVSGYRPPPGSRYPPGTPAVGDHGGVPGQIQTPGGTIRTGILIHGPGRTDGCLACDSGAHREVKRIMDANDDSGGTWLIIVEVCCKKKNE